MSPTKTCSKCESPALPSERCNKCKKFQDRPYCSAECRRGDWESHKDNCEGGAARTATKQAHVPKVSKKQTEAKAGNLNYMQFTNLSSGHQSKEYIGAGFWVAQLNGFALHVTVAPRAAIMARSAQYSATELKVSKALGFPLRLLGTHDRNSNIPNLYTETLLMDPDPKSPTFSWSGCSTIPTGRTIVTRIDGEPLHIGQVTAFIQYCCSVKAAMPSKKDRAACNDGERRRALVENYLSPAGFKKYFNDMKQVESLKDPKTWEGVECPV